MYNTKNATVCKAKECLIHPLKKSQGIIKQGILKSLKGCKAPYSTVSSASQSAHERPVHIRHNFSSLSKIPAFLNHWKWLSASAGQI